MPLTVGTKLGPYEILASIGKGGMGEVYRAHDSRMGRDVAIKISAERFNERFDREVRAVAALNHSNICHVYDVGPNYLVMELVEGPTLAERIKEGPIPFEEALGLARQIADALEAAHEKGIIHRDVKPGNIKIRSDAVVKVLDFGLATAVSRPSEGEAPSILSTESMALTEAGTVLGTAAYMAPEQAQGKSVDKRADIWAFGVVLFEMLTGRRLFSGDSVSDILAGVLKEEPKWDRVPAKARRLLKSCLEKDPKHRLRDIGDAWILLEEKPANGGQGRLLPWATAGVLFVVLAAVIVLWAPWRSTPRTEQPLVRLDVDLGPDVALGAAYGPSVILSPDGSRLVYVSREKLVTRRLDQSKATELTGTEGASGPFFSPDGKWVAFFAAGQLRKVSVEGGAVVALCNASNTRGGSWGDAGNIVAALDTVGGLSRIPESGGAPVPLTELASGESTHRWPQILPGGKAVLFTANTSPVGFDGASIEVISLADHRRKTLHRGGSFGRYLPSGHLIYINQGTLFAVPFDLNALEFRGTPTPVLEQIAYSSLNGFAQLDFSRTETLVYRTGTGSGQVTVQWLDSTGKPQPLLAKPGNYLYPRVSPDGSRLVLGWTTGSEQDLWVYDWRRDLMTRLTTGAAQATLIAAWTPDGRILVLPNQSGGGMVWTRSDGGSQPQVLTSGRNRQVPWSFTPDGKRLAFQEVDPETGYDLWTMPVESDGSNLHAGKPEPFLRTPFDERQPTFSPDGRWLAYASNESGTFQIYVRAFPDTGGKWLIRGGLHPVWSRAAHELIFRTEDNQVMAATYTVQGDTFMPDKPRAWSERRLADVGLLRNFDLAPDGKRIAGLMPATTPEAQAAQSHIVFLQNFFDELRRKVPPGK